MSKFLWSDREELHLLSREKSLLVKENSDRKKIIFADWNDKYKIILIWYQMLHLLL